MKKLRSPSVLFWVRFHTQQFWGTCFLMLLYFQDLCIYSYVHMIFIRHVLDDIYIDKTRRDLRLSPLWWLYTQASTSPDQNPSDRFHLFRIFSGLLLAGPMPNKFSKPKKLLHLKKGLHIGNSSFQMLSYLIEWSTTEKTNLRNVRNWSYLALPVSSSHAILRVTGSLFNFTKVLNYRALCPPGSKNTIMQA